MIGTANQNTSKRLVKRRYSRGSAPAFNNIDFEYTGNTANVHHLIQHARGPNNHTATDLNFELNLRSYKLHPDTVVPEQDVPFKYPKPTQKIDSVQIFKGQFKPLVGRRLEAEYREAFPEKNFNNVRCFKNQTTKHQKTLLQW